MSNISKIKISGTSYSIKDENACNVVELTQAEYDDLPTTAKTSNSLFVITDAEAGDLSNYYTKTETDNAITAATSTKQDTLVSGTNIKTINGETLLGEGNIEIQGGGGKAIEAGRGITVTTGETADTVSFNIPISAGTGTGSIIEGYAIPSNGMYTHAEGMNTKANGIASHAEGMNTSANGSVSHTEGTYTYANGIYSHTEGYYTIANNASEHASGQYNNSVSASTTFGDSGNTLFSVGNGTENEARHNAFEIRQNGDIYITKDGQDVKLQDQLGGGGTSYTAGDGIDINNNIISVTGKVDTSTYETYTAATDTALASKQTTLTAGTGISIVDNVISATGGGITSIEVQTMIDESISGKTNQNDNLFTIRTNVIKAVTISGGENIRIIFAFDIIQNNQIVLSTDTVNDKSSLLSALATLGFDNKIYDIRGINYSDDTSNTSYFGEFLGHKCYAVLLSYVPDFGSITIGLKRNDVYYTLDAVCGGKYNYNYLDNKPTITTSITSESTDAQVPSAKAVYDQLDGLKLKKITQSEYDALSPNYDANTLYVING